VQSLEQEVSTCKQLTGAEDNRQREDLQHSQQECKSLQNWISIMEDELKMYETGEFYLIYFTESFVVEQAQNEAHPAGGGK
jgi:hypothetical protein